jgi:hypothetical protein
MNAIIYGESCQLKVLEVEERNNNDIHSSSNVLLRIRIMYVFSSKLTKYVVVITALNTTYPSW